MMSLRPWLSLLRISNLPTVWSNVIAGAGLALVAPGAALPAGVQSIQTGWPALHCAVMAASAAYLGGMVLNDALDVAVDRRRGVARPIVAGQIQHRAAWWIAVGLLLAATLLSLPLGAHAFVVMALLLAAIIGYDVLHHCWKGSVVLMGVCRSLAVGLGAASMAPEGLLCDTSPGLIALAVTSGVYTVLLTVIARREHREGQGGGGGHPLGLRRFLALLLPLMTWGVILWFDDPVSMATVLMAGLVLAWQGWAAWQVLRAQPKIRAAVMAWIAGLALLDGLALAAAGLPAAAWASAGCFLLTVLAQRAVSGT